VITLPQLVFGHVVPQYTTSKMVLRTRHADCRCTAHDGSPAGSLKHGHVVPRRFVGVRVSWKAKEQGKGQGRTKNANCLAEAFGKGCRSLQDIGADAKTRVTAASFLPPVRTSVIDTVRDKVGSTAHAHHASSHYYETGIGSLGEVEVKAW